MTLEERVKQILAEAKDLSDAGFSLSVGTSWYRCGNCNQPQHAGTVSVSVPDGIMEGDPWWCVQEELRELRFGGEATGWCVTCARKLMENNQ